MTFVDYFKDKLLLLLLHLSCMMVLAFFLHATGYPAADICIILVVWLLILSIWFLTEYFRRRQYFHKTAEILAHADHKYLLGELMPQSFRLEDTLYRNMIRQSNKSVIESIRTVEDARQEYREYIESWVHEIKAPYKPPCPKPSAGFSMKIRKRKTTWTWLSSTPAPMKCTKTI